MRRVLSIMLVLLLLTGCAPQPAATEPTPEPVVQPTETFLPTQTPAPTAEDALHELLADYAPQSLNMFRPFKPIAISPGQFMEEMAAIRALPFEERTDWFMEHGLCIPEPSEDTDVDWQMETNLWSTYADYRSAVAGEPIPGYKDGLETQWQMVFSDPVTPGGANRCPYAVLFERVIGEEWYLIDILYAPHIWNSSRLGHTLMSMRTENTFSLYDPAQRNIILTVPAGELNVEAEGAVTRYVYDSWDWDPYTPLDGLHTQDAVVIHLLYESYPSEDAEFSARTDFGGRALVYKMESLRPELVQNVVYPNCDPDSFLDADAKDFLSEDFSCPAYSEDRGDRVIETELFLTEKRVLTVECIMEHTQPLSKYWRDQELSITRIRILENGTLLQTVEISELARLAEKHPDTDGGFTLYPENVPYALESNCDYNLDGFNDLRIRFKEMTGSSYYLIWDEQAQQYVFWRANGGGIQIDKEARTLTYENTFSNYCGTHTDNILPDGSIEHATLTVTHFITDPPEVFRVMQCRERCDPPKEYVWQKSESGEWTEVLP